MYCRSLFLNASLDNDVSLSGRKAFPMNSELQHKTSVLSKGAYACEVSLWSWLGRGTTMTELHANVTQITECLHINIKAKGTKKNNKRHRNLNLPDTTSPITTSWTVWSLKKWTDWDIGPGPFDCPASFVVCFCISVLSVFLLLTFREEVEKLDTQQSHHQFH